jgi:hypothetical protein
MMLAKIYHPDAESELIVFLNEGVNGLSKAISFWLGFSSTLRRA